MIEESQHSESRAGDDHIPLAAWLPVLGISVLAVIFFGYYLALREVTGGFDQISLALESGKVHWGSSSIILDTILVVGLVVGLLILFKYPGFSRRQWRGIGPAYGAALVVLVVVALQPLSGSAGDTLLQCLFAVVEPAGTLVRINNVAGALLLPTLILACICLILSVKNQDCDVQCLGGRMRWFRRILYVSGAFAAATTYQFFRLYHWSAQVTALSTFQSFSPDGASSNCLMMQEALIVQDAATNGGLQNLASSVALGSGLVFSCALALVFIPPALVLNRELELTISRKAASEPDFDAERWLAAQNLVSSPTKAAGSYVAVFLPAITGLLTKFLEANIIPA